MSPSSHVRLAVELTDSEAIELAAFIKRVRFEHVCEVAGVRQAIPNERTHLMLGALNQVGGALRHSGYPPQ
jgi:hypothetical protein